MVNVESHSANPEKQAEAQTPMLSIGVSHHVMGTAQTRHCRSAFVKPSNRSDGKARALQTDTCVNAKNTATAVLQVVPDDRGPRGALSFPGRRLHFL